MKISVRNLEPTKVKLTVTVDPEEFNPYLDEARKEIAKQVNVPGFRKGHVPGKIIDQRIGFGAVAGEAVNNGVPELYSKALETKKIHPMAQPEIDVQEVPESAKDETKLKFVATVERRPDIELPEVDGMEIEVEKAEITDEDINNRLEALRQRFGTLVGVDRPAAKGDYANIAKLEEGLEIPVPKGVKAEMVEQQLKNVTADPDKATKEQKAEAEETVEKELRDQMVLDVLAEKMDVKVSQADVFNFLASIAQQYGMDPNAFIQAIMRNGQLGSAVQEVGRSKGLLAGMRAVTFKSDGETLDLSAFLGEAAEDEEAESVEAASAAAAVADELAADKDAE